MTRHTSNTEKKYSFVQKSLVVAVFVEKLQLFGRTINGKTTRRRNCRKDSSQLQLAQKTTPEAYQFLILPPSLTSYRKTSYFESPNKVLQMYTNKYIFMYYSCRESEMRSLLLHKQFQYVKNLFSPFVVGFFPSGLFL